MRERVLQIRLALLGDGRRLVPFSEYLELCKRSIAKAIEQSGCVGTPLGVIRSRHSCFGIGAIALPIEDRSGTC